MTYSFHQVLTACLEFGMSEAERDAFERLLRFPYAKDGVLNHPKFTCNLYIKLRDLGLDDDQVLDVLEALR